MGTVWRARDEALGRDVAVKELAPPPDLTGRERETFIQRTLREARAAGRVSHPNVATVYDVVEDRGRPWIAMELLPPRTLGEEIRERGRLPPAEVAAIGIQILAALRAAHAARVLHRDIKPDNVLLGPNGRAVLTDFGIATVEDDPSATRTGAVIGTPAFIAPERAAGGPAERASDLWSLGVTIYAAVEGRTPFRGDHALAVLRAVLHEEPHPFVHAGPLAPVIAGLLHKDPARRTTAEQLRPRLQAIATRCPPQATAPIPIVASPDHPRSAHVRAARAPRGSAPTATPAHQARRATPRTLTALCTLILGVGVVAGGLAWLSHAKPVAPQVADTPGAATSSPPAPRQTARGQVQRGDSGDGQSGPRRRPAENGDDERGDPVDRPALRDENDRRKRNDRDGDGPRDGDRLPPAGPHRDGDALWGDDRGRPWGHGGRGDLDRLPFPPGRGRWAGPKPGFSAPRPGRGFRGFQDSARTRSSDSARSAG